MRLLCPLAALALGATAFAARAAAPVPTPIGSGPKYRLPAAPAAVLRAAPVGRFSCREAERRHALVHVELFAERRVLLLPPGIGMAPPLGRRGAAVTGARCSYALRTTGPTGVVELVAAARPTLGDLFAVWGQPLSARRLAGFHTKPGDRVRAWVDGRRWRGEVRSLPLRDRGQVVVEIGGYVPPHASYLFPR